MYVVDGHIDESNDDESPVLYKHSPYCDGKSLIDVIQSKKDTFTILSRNCQSLHAKFDLLKIYP